MNARTPVPVERDDERFMVREPLEIVAALRRVIAHREMLSLYWGGSFGLSALLAVDAADGSMVFDCLADSHANRKLLEAGSANVVAVLDGVKLQFEAVGIEQVPYHGAPALRAPLPEDMLRLQRREAFRVPASLECQVALELDGKVRVLELRVADLSLGGMALVTDAARLPAQPGQMIDACRLPLGKDGAVTASAQVTSVVKSNTKSGSPQLRIGCRFVELPRQVEQQLSRYIAQLERSTKR